MQRLRPQTEEVLRAAVASAARGSIELRRVHRLHAVLLVSIGRSCGEVAHWFGDDPRSVERWVQAYESQGIEGLRDHPGAGRPARLSPAQREQLGRELAADPSRCGYAQARWSGKLLAQHLARLYGVQISQRHCQRLLQRLAH